MGRRCIIKERFSKKYRHPSLDSKLTLKCLNAVSFLVTHLLVVLMKEKSVCLNPSWAMEMKLEKQEWLSVDSRA